MYNGIITYSESHELGKIFYHELNKSYNNSMHIVEANEVFYSYRAINDLLRTKSSNPIVFVALEYHESHYFPITLFKKQLLPGVDVRMIIETPSLLHCLARDTAGFKKVKPTLPRSDYQGFCDRVNRCESRLVCSYQDLIDCIDLKAVIKHPDNKSVFDCLVDIID
jgi:hypothetical protein